MSANLKRSELIASTDSSSQCQSCHGTGWQQIRQLDGNLAVRRCSSPLHTIERLSALGVPPRYQHFALSAFFSRQESERQAKQMVYRFIRQFPRSGAGLIISGPAGSGKTHLVIGLIRQLLRQSLAIPRFVDTNQLLRELDLELNLIELDQRQLLLDSTISADLLVLDDLIGLPLSISKRDILDYIISYRYRQLLPIVITTRLNLVELKQQLGSNAFSRLAEMCDLLSLGQ
ncbi:MAG: ATP-binding protein [Acidobacteriota bacterium]